MEQILLTDDGFVQSNVEIEPEIEENKPVKKSPFDFVNAINYTNENLFGFNELNERVDRCPNEYPKFIINRSLSYFADTIMFANVANQYLNNVPNYSHFDFYRLAVSKKRRFSKWAKPIRNDDIDLICKHFNYSISRAIEALNILTEDQLKQIRDLYDLGGKKK